MLDCCAALKPHQVHELLQLLGMKTGLDEVQQMISEIDTDSSGTVDFEEFLQVSTHKHTMTCGITTAVIGR